MEETPAARTVELERLLDWIRDMREQFSREMDQAILKRDLYLGMEAMGGRDACDRIKRQIDARFQMDENWKREIARPAKPQRSPLPSWYREKKHKSSVA